MGRVITHSCTVWSSIVDSRALCAAAFVDVLRREQAGSFHTGEVAMQVPVCFASQGYGWCWWLGHVPAAEHFCKPACSKLVRLYSMSIGIERNVNVRNRNYDSRTNNYPFN